MNFWKDLTDALPSKSLARGRELHYCDIDSISEVPDYEVAVYPEGYQCEICKVTPKKAFSQNTTIFEVSISDNSRLSFHLSSDNQVVVCGGCLVNFNLLNAYTRTLAIKAAAETIEPDSYNIVTCSRCKKKNRVPTGKAGIAICGTCGSRLSEQNANVATNENKKETVEDTKQTSGASLELPRGFRLHGECAYCKSYSEHLYTGKTWKCLICSKYYDSKELELKAKSMIRSETRKTP